MARVNIAAAGNAEDNINLINPRFQAEALRKLRGRDCGVLDNSFYTSASANGYTRSPNSAFMWPLTAINTQSITVGRGMATAYGYDIQSEQSISLTATAPSAGTKYVFIYLEWDLSNPVEAVGSLLVHDNGASASWTPPYQDNLITNPIGKYQMPLYRLTVNTSGTITETKNWESLGVATIGYPLRAEHANHAEKADDTSTLAGEAVSLSGTSLKAGGKALFRTKQIYSGEWYLMNTASKEASITLTEGLSVGDLIMVEIVPTGWYSASNKASNHPQVHFVRVNKIDSMDATGFTIVALQGGATKSSGFTATSDSFAVSGTTLTYKGGYYLLNFANDETNGTLLENNQICLTGIYKCYH